MNGYQLPTHKELKKQRNPPSPGKEPTTGTHIGFFYSFTIITNGPHQIFILRITPTTIAVERSLTYIFITFAHVGMTRMHHTLTPSQLGVRNVLPTLICSSFSLFNSRIPHFLSLPGRPHSSVSYPTSSRSASPQATSPHGTPQCRRRPLGLCPSARLALRSRLPPPPNRPSPVPS